MFRRGSMLLCGGVMQVRKYPELTVGRTRTMPPLRGPDVLCIGAQEMLRVEGQVCLVENIREILAWLACEFHDSCKHSSSRRQQFLQQ